VLNHGGKYSEGTADYMATTVGIVMAHMKGQAADKPVEVAPIKAAAPLISPGNIATIFAKS